MVFGCTGSVTSASTGWVDPWIVMSASCAAGPPVQVACIAAHVGTTPGLPSGLGLGNGVGVASVGLEEGLEDASALGVGDGLEREAEPFVPPHPATANTAMTAVSLSPTRESNGPPPVDVTPARTEVIASTISQPVSGSMSTGFTN
jgi:hypothetical protein